MNKKLSRLRQDAQKWAKQGGFGAEGYGAYVNTLRAPDDEDELTRTGGGAPKHRERAAVLFGEQAETYFGGGQEPTKDLNALLDAMSGIDDESIRVRVFRTSGPTLVAYDNNLAGNWMGFVVDDETHALAGVIGDDEFMVADKYASVTPELEA